MRVYMVFCRKTGKWWKRRGTAGSGWYDKQEDGSVWTRRPGNVLTAAKKKDRRGLHEPVIMPFSLTLVIEGVNDGTEDTVVVGGEVWQFDHESDSWLTGTRTNGAGVYITNVTPITRWGGSAVINGKLLADSVVGLDRDDVMNKAIELWRRHVDEDSSDSVS